MLRQHNFRRCRKQQNNSLARRSILGAAALYFLASGCGRPPDPDLTGTWEERDDHGTLLSLWTFAASGHFTYDHLPEPTMEDAEHLAGTFAIVDGAELAIDAIDVGARQRMRSQVSFLVRGDQLAPEAFVAEDSQPDLLGVWRQTSLRQTLDAMGQVTWEDRRTQSIELQPAGQLRLVQTIGDDPPDEVPGHYDRLGDGRYQITLDLPQVSISFTVQPLDGAALATRVYRRTIGSSPSLR